MKRFVMGSVSVVACAMCLALSCQPAFAADADTPIIRVVDQSVVAEAPASPVAGSLATPDGEGASASAAIDAAADKGEAATGANAEKVADGTDGNSSAANSSASNGEPAENAVKDSKDVADGTGADVSSGKVDNSDAAGKGLDAERSVVAPGYHGWIIDETGTYFYDDGVLVTGDYIIDCKIYHFDDETGALVHGWLADESSETWRYFSPETGILQRGEAYLPSEADEADGAGGKRYWYYLDDTTGARLYGWKYIAEGSKWVYYDPTFGWMSYGEQYIPCGNDAGDECRWYYLDDTTGARLYGWKYIAEGSKWVYYDPTFGWMSYGEQYIPCGNDAGDECRWYYLDDTTGARLYGWKYIAEGSKWVYYDPTFGWMSYGEQYIPCGNDAGDECRWYYLDDTTGARLYGWKYIAEGSKWVYYDPTFGWMSYGEQCLPCGNTDGALLYWYFFNPVTGAVTYGWQWLESGAKWVCYEEQTGKMLYGQQLLHANAEDADYHWYLFDSETGAAAHGLAWVRDEHKGVLYDQVMGWMLYGWHDVDGVSYHLREGDGALIGVRCANGYVSNYVTWMLEMAADDSHGYDQGYRWGERGDYDCSSLVVSSLRASGFETGGATYTGNMVYNLTRNGFSWLGDFSNLQVGDILLNEEVHTAVYLGGGLLVHASGNEWGGALGGQPGDQTGTEICVRSYFWEPWDGYLRYRG